MYPLCGAAGATTGGSTCGGCAGDTGQGLTLPREERRAELASAAGTRWWPLQSHLKGLVSQHPANGTPAIAQVPATPRFEVPRGTTAPRATTSSAGQVATAPGTPAHPVRPWAFPGVTGFQLPPFALMAVPERCVPRASPHHHQVPVLSREVAAPQGWDCSVGAGVWQGERLPEATAVPWGVQGCSEPWGARSPGTVPDLTPPRHVSDVLHR